MIEFRHGAPGAEYDNVPEISAPEAPRNLSPCSIFTAPVTEIYLQITDVQSGNRVVTIIEFISPSNKRPGPGREEYLRKRGMKFGRATSILWRLI